MQFVLVNIICFLIYIKCIHCNKIAIDREGKLITRGKIKDNFNVNLVKYKLSY